MLQLLSQLQRNPSEGLDALIEISNTHKGKEMWLSPFCKIFVNSHKGTDFIDCKLMDRLVVLPPLNYCCANSSVIKEESFSQLPVTVTAAFISTWWHTWLCLREEWCIWRSILFTWKSLISVLTDSALIYKTRLTSQKCLKLYLHDLNLKWVLEPRERERWFCQRMLFGHCRKTLADNCYCIG